MDIETIRQQKAAYQKELEEHFRVREQQQQALAETDNRIVALSGAIGACATLEAIEHQAMTESESLSTGTEDQQPESKAEAAPTAD